jgi:hypothetical protein
MVPPRQLPTADAFGPAMMLRAADSVRITADRPSARAVRQNPERSTVMRIAYAALMSLLLAAVPSVGFAQVVIPCSPQAASRDGAIKDVVPAATVTRLGDAIGLADARQADTFVLGAATLDMKDPACTKVAFTMTNATDAPISLTNVSLHGVRVNSRPEDGRLKTACSISVPSVDHRFLKDDTLRPGATVTVEMPIALGCPALGKTVGFLVSIRSDGTQWFDGKRVEWGPDPAYVQEDALLRKAFEKLLSQAQQ